MIELLKVIDHAWKDRSITLSLDDIQDYTAFFHAIVPKLPYGKASHLKLDRFMKIYGNRHAYKRISPDYQTREHTRKSELESELDGDHEQPVSYETVRSLIARFEHLLRSSSIEQQKTLFHLIIRKITVDNDRKIDKIEMTFDETTEQHFLSLAPSADIISEGAFPLNWESPKLRDRITLSI